MAKKKRGRPKLPAKERKSKNLNIPITEEQEEELEIRAKKEELDKTVYARRKIFLIKEESEEVN